MAEFEVILAALCDDVRQEMSGKVSLMGVFNRFRVIDFTQSLPSFRAFIQVAVQEEGQYPIVLNIRSEQRDFKVGMQTAFQAINRDEIYRQYITTINVGFNNLKVPRPGMYYVELECKGNVICSLPVLVTAVEPSPVQ